MRAGASRERIEAALAAGDVEAAMQAIPWKTIERLGPEMTAELRKVVDKAAKVAATALPKGISISFSVTNPRALDWIRAHAAELVEKNVMAGSQEAIREIMRRAFAEGWPPREAAQLIKEYIGLLPRHATAVENYRQALLKKFKDQGFTITAESDAARLAVQYANKLLKLRAETIARHETMLASNEGQRELWRQGVEQDQLVAGEWEREWIVTDDDRLCDLCMDMQGETADFPEGAYDGGSGGPPLHVQCRCCEGLRKIDQKFASPPAPRAPGDVHETIQ